MKNWLTLALLSFPLIASGQHAIGDALQLIGLSFTQQEIDSMSEAVLDAREGYEEMRQYPLDNAVPPALYFNPLMPGAAAAVESGNSEWHLPKGLEVPIDRSELAFFSVLELAALIKDRKITSTELTRFFLERLKTHGDTLACVITLTESLALRQAAQADQEISAGLWRGPLHGIPYGAKDLLAVPGYRTTWGAAPYKEQVINETATVVEKLEEAGAVLVAKLTLGALAWGDVWYGGKTKNPWNLEQGSSGSSAGSASATAAGLVPFSIGTETLGSIVSPSTRCHVTGLRPSYGRVSRYGAMALSWSMDKIGPICRSAQDCAVVFDAIQGVDGKDLSLIPASFSYDSGDDPRTLKVGYFDNLFRPGSRAAKEDSLALQALRQSGIHLEPIEYDLDLPIGPLRIILGVEAATAFDQLTISDQDSLLVRQIKRAWPNAFREARLIPAVEYLKANRYRTLLVQQFSNLIEDYDVVVTPSFSGSQLLVTNLTGHPCLVMPHGFAESGSGTSISFIGNLFEEEKILQLGAHFQEITNHDEMRPGDFSK
ncbi:MAG: amidase [Saprospiraceae bacterium]|nr:amidase [Saprospiraceae bacterium]